MKFITVSWFTPSLFFSLPSLQIGHRGQPYVNNTKVKNFIHWIKTKTDSGEMKNTVIGGYYPYPPVPETFSKYSTSVKGTNRIATFSMIFLYATCMVNDILVSLLYSFIIWG